MYNIKQIVIGLLSIFFVINVLAQGSENSPIRIIVPFGPGSGTDIATRMLANKLENKLHRSVIVENKVGANGTIAAQFVAKAGSDSRVFLMGTNSTHGANPGLIAKLQYDPREDFIPVNMVAIFNSFMIVRPTLSVRTPRELEQYANLNNHELTFAAGNTSSMIMGEMFSRKSGIKMLRVPYTSNPAALIDLMAGRIDVMFPDIGSSYQHVKDGKLRALGVVTLGERSKLIPEMPMVSEFGYKDFNFVGWIGLFAPKGTPASIIAELESVMKQIIDESDVVAKFLQIGAEPKWMDAQSFSAFVDSELTRLPAMLLEYGIVPQ